MNEPGIQNRDMTLPAGVATALLCALFGSNAVAIKLSLKGYGIFTTAATRFAIASVAIFFWARFTGRGFAVKKGFYRHIFIVSILFTSQLGLFYLGLSMTEATRATLIVNLQPFVVLVLAHFFIEGDRITLRKVAGMVLGFSGVILVITEGQGAGSGFRGGDLIILSCTLIWGTVAVYTKRVIHDFQPFQFVLYPMMFAAPVYLVFALIFDPVMLINPDTVSTGALLYQSLLTASLGFVLWNTLLQKYGSVAMHSFIFIMPVSGVLLGGLVLGEPLTLKIFLSLLLIVSGILVVLIKPKDITIFPFRRWRI